MEKETLRRKIYASLLAGAVGDAMGAATETRSRRQIIEHFGGYVTDILKPGDDVFARGFERGSVTDDFSLAYHTARAIIEDDGLVTDETAARALISWSNSPYVVMAGPTTMAAINALKGEAVTSTGFPAVDNSKGSNGSAMKIAPVGLASHGNIDKAIRDAITICKPTHFNSTSLAGACAVAAAVSAGLREDSTVESVIKAGLRGAAYGEEYGTARERQLACPSVYKRILLAVSIANRHQDDLEGLMIDLADYVGSGLAAAEAVPCAFGIFAGTHGDAGKAIFAGVNIGNDTDTVATIAAAICGSFNGYENREYLKLINEVNGFDLEQMAAQLSEVSHD